MLKKKRSIRRKASIVEDGPTVNDEPETDICERTASNADLNGSGRRQSVSSFFKGYQESKDLSGSRRDSLIEAFKDEFDLLATPAVDLLNVLDTLLSVAGRPCILSDLDLLPSSLRETITQITLDQKEMFDITQEACRLGGRLSHAFDVKTDASKTQAAEFQSKIDELNATFEVTRRDLTTARLESKMLETQLRDENKRLKDINDSERRFWDAKLQESQKKVDSVIETMRRETQYLVSEAAQSTGHVAFERVEELESEVRLLSLKLDRKKSAVSTLEHDLEVAKTRFEGDIPLLKKELNDKHRIEIVKLENHHQEIERQYQSKIYSQEEYIISLSNELQLNGLRVPRHPNQVKRHSGIPPPTTEDLNALINDLQQKLLESESKINALELELDQAQLNAGLWEGPGDFAAKSISANILSNSVVVGRSAGSLVPQACEPPDSFPLASSMSMSGNWKAPALNNHPSSLTSSEAHQQQIDSIREECQKIQEESNRLIEAERKKIQQYVDEMQNSTDSELQQQVLELQSTIAELRLSNNETRSDEERALKKMQKEAEYMRVKWENEKEILTKQVSKLSIEISRLNNVLRLERQSSPRSEKVAESCLAASVSLKSQKVIEDTKPLNRNINTSEIVSSRVANTQSHQSVLNNSCRKNPTTATVDNNTNRMHSSIPSPNLEGSLRTRVSRKPQQQQLQHQQQQPQQQQQHQQQQQQQQYQQHQDTNPFDLFSTEDTSEPQMTFPDSINFVSPVVGLASSLQQPQPQPQPQPQTQPQPRPHPHPQPHISHSYVSSINPILLRYYFKLRTYSAFRKTWKAAPCSRLSFRLLELMSAAELELKINNLSDYKRAMQLAEDGRCIGAMKEFTNLIKCGSLIKTRIRFRIIAKAIYTRKLRSNPRNPITKKHISHSEEIIRLYRRLFVSLVRSKGSHPASFFRQEMTRIRVIDIR
eukprot:TRINITY_DN15010_c0_g1_i1.p1 TRINITY_DN15010_c0_g1~~TRINITY_DN15010_c0_g1_i1.p1  ORF type:complete len:957 (+),score=193.50 TRINITY_DN15010_c0_g1_i1:49-2871(+)